MRTEDETLTDEPTKALTEKQEKPEKKSVKKKELAKYKTNPFIPAASQNSKIGTKRLSNKKGDKLMVVSEETGEIIAPAGFHTIMEVDKTQFVKLFKNGVKAFTNLTNAGAKVFSFMYDEMSKNRSQDYIYLTYQDICDAGEPISKATFHRGMLELLQHNFLAQTEKVGKYFVNPDYVWNGNRLAFIREFRLKSAKPKDTKTKDMFENQEQQLLENGGTDENQENEKA